MSKTLRIATWNANGLLQKLALLELFLNKEKIDICLISETHLKKDLVVNVNGYSCYHATHPTDRAKGGSSVFLRNTIKHCVDPKVEEDSVQMVSVNIQLINKGDFKISAVYYPPKFNLKKEDYAKLFHALKHHFIVGGDFNAKNTFWGSRLTNTKGKELFKAACQFKAEILSGGAPTYWPTDVNKIPDLIDFYLVKGISSGYIEVRNSEDLFSDHSPVVLIINEEVVAQPKMLRLTNNRTDWGLFRHLLEESIDLQVPLKDSLQLDEEVLRFNSNVQKAAWLSTPKSSSRQKQKLFIISPEVKELLMKKRKARKTWQRARTAENKKTLNRLCNDLKELIKKEKNESLGNFLSNVTAQKDTDYSLWKCAKSFKRPNIQSSPIRRQDGSWAKSAKDKADTFAEHLEATFQPLPQQTVDESIILVQKEDRSELKKVSLKELREEIKNNLSAKKAPGFDLITGQIIKELPEKATRKLQHLINSAFRLGYVPSLWKVAEVIMIPKSDKSTTDPKTYRPISLLPVISKLFEKLFLKRMKPLLEERGLIPDHQFGFRERHSTIEQVHRITNKIEKALEENKICSAVFLDVAQAFDKVWHKGLECKLHRDLPEEYYLLLRSYLHDRYFRVKQESEYSSLRKIAAGVPQGSVIGPILYLLFTRDLPNSKETMLATFADDTAVLAEGNDVKQASRKLQSTIKEVYDWTKRWRIKLNESKSVHINFTNRKIENYKIFIGEQEIPYSNKVKYLGMTLDAKLNWKEHVKKKKDQLNLKLRKMHWMIGRSSQVTVQNKLLLYKQILRPVWTYGIQLWGCTKKSNMNIIQTFQNKVLRGIVDAPWYIRNDNLHRDLGVELVSDVVTRTSVSHERKMKFHTNKGILKLVKEAPQQLRRLKRLKPCDLVKD